MTANARSAVVFVSKLITWWSRQACDGLGRPVPGQHGPGFAWPAGRYASSLLDLPLSCLEKMYEPFFFHFAKEG